MGIIEALHVVIEKWILLRRLISLKFYSLASYRILAFECMADGLHLSFDWRLLSL